jgi:hypothetical protein
MMQRSVTSLSSHLLSLFLPLTTALIFISSFLAPSHKTRQGTGHGSGHGSPTATTQPNPPPPPFRFSPSPTTKLLLVSSLDDTGPSTLRSCIESAGPRVCLFQVAGVIELNRQIKARFPDLLVAGETAPAPGITLVGAGLSIETSNVELRHLAIRPGDGTFGAKPSERDGVSIGAEPPRSAHNVSLQHLSLTWAIDENLSAWHPTTRDISVRDSIIAEGLHRSIHPKGPHSKGVMVGRGVRRVVLERNLIAFNEERNPYLQPGSSSKLINNVVYGWGPRGPWSICNLTNNDSSRLPVRAAILGNVFLPGPSSYRDSPPVYSKRLAPGSQIFLQDNAVFAPFVSEGLADNLPPSFSPAATCPFKTGCAAALSSTETESFVLTHAGSRPKQRAFPDRRIVADVRARRGELKDCLRGCRRETGDLEVRDPIFRRLNPPRLPAADQDGDGVSELDEWLAGFLAEVE